MTLDHPYFTPAVLNITLLNIGGLSNKIEVPEFFNQVTSNDIFAIVETKLANFDLPNTVVPNYKFIAKNRTKFKHKSGGIGVLLKVTFIDSSRF